MSTRSHATATRADRFGEEQRRRFLDSPHSEVHRALFDLARNLPYVWVKGKQDYGIRAAHKNYSSGVSLLRSQGPECLLIGERR